MKSRKRNRNEKESEKEGRKIVFNLNIGSLRG